MPSIRRRWPFLARAGLSIASSCAPPLAASNGPEPPPDPLTSDASVVEFGPFDDGALAASAGDATAAPTAPPAASEGGTAETNGDADAADDGSASTDGPEGGCATPLAAGDLRIDELMIESVAGTGDYGEWLEVASARDCAVDLRGLRGECANGAKLATFAVTDDWWIPPFGSFVVADSPDAAINHQLPGVLFAWSKRAGDVLRNKGGTVTLWVGDLLIDTVTYPALTLTVGASMAFPSDCDPALRADWTRWQVSTSSWFPAFFGTPNAVNGDVSCPP